MDTRLLGIDYGSKRIGLAISDTAGRFPAPYRVIANDDLSVKRIIQIAKENKIDKIVIGKSIDYLGKPNPIFNQVEKLGNILGAKLSMTVVYEDETLSSKEAERIVGRDESYDARAAALILKSFIDRQNI